ncbi:uncharacterized protein LOC135372765 [Ornithodoros turicata]|uniref:uncharacterized protein LOC135372765 n=1 Tax=Ornithodoros turicata TaxID=34597 RepID=UPI0031387E25
MYVRSLIPCSERPSFITFATTYRCGERVFEIKSGCFRSQKKTGAPYVVHVGLSESGAINGSLCNCTAGSGGCCNHAVGVLKTLALIQRLGYKQPPQELACTELPQQWGRPRSSMGPEDVMSVNWRRVSDGGRTDPLLCRLFDVRKKTESEEEKRNAALTFAEKLKGLVGNSLTDTIGEAASCSYTNTKYGRAPRDSVMAVQQSLLPFGFECLIGVEPGHSTGHITAQEFSLFEGCRRWIPDNSKTSSTLTSILLSVQEARQLEKDTRQQAGSQLWKDSRKNRLTASRFGAVCKRKQPWTKAGLRNLIRPKDFSSASVRYGVANEHNAVLRYHDVLRHINRDVVTFSCGLMVRPDCPWLGATPDRVVYDPLETSCHGILEVKCPSSKRATSLQEALAHKDFCIYVSDGKPYLKKDHDYYYQMIGQMYCANASWGHFVVYSQSWLIVARVGLCESFCNDMVKNLNEFYFQSALPYIEGLV